MPGVLMRMVIYGFNDVFLTGKPQINKKQFDRKKCLFKTKNKKYHNNIIDLDKALKKIII